MAKEELGKLSSEQIQKLAKTISEAKELPSQQEEIIKKVLDGEIEIGNTRITSLERYFDIYSKNLDKVAEKYSDLDDAFLVLNNKLNENYKKLSSDITDLSKQLKKATEESGKEPSKKPPKKSSKKGTEPESEDIPSKKQTKTKSTESLLDKGTSEAIKQIAKALTDRKGSTSITGDNPLNRSVDAANKGSSKAPVKKQPTTEQTAADIKVASAAASPVQTAGLTIPSDPIAPKSAEVEQQPIEPQPVEVANPVRPEAVLAPIQIEDTSIKESSADHLKYINDIKKAINELNDASESGDQARVKSARASYREISNKYSEHLDSLRDQKEKDLNESAARAAQANTKQLEQEQLANLTAEAQYARLTEFRLKELDKVLNAEKATQKELAKAQASGNEAEIQRASAKQNELKQLQENYLNDLIATQQAYFKNIEEQEEASKASFVQSEPEKPSAPMQTAADIKDASAVTTTGQTAEPTGQVAQTQARQPTVPETVKVESGATGVDDTARATMQTGDIHIEELLAAYSKYAAKIAEVRAAIEELDAASQSGDDARIQSAQASYDKITEGYSDHIKALQAKKEEHLKHIRELEEAAEDKQRDLEVARLQTQEMQAARLTEFRLKELDKVLDAEKAAQDFANQVAAEIAFANSAEAGDFRAREVAAEDELKSAKELARRKAEYIAEAEREARLKAEDGKLSPAAAKRIKEEANAKFKADKENLDKITKERLKKEAEEEAKKKKAKQKAEKDEKDRQKRAGEQAIADAVTGPLNKENNLLKRFNDLKNLTKDEEGNKIKGAGLAVAVKAISDLAKQLENTVDEIGKYKGNIDTRLQGSNNEKFAGSYWDQLTKDMASVGAITPFFQQKDFANNIKSLVDRGIAFDLKQRAFLMTIQDKIANTFEVADGTLLRLIRIQQEDSTAGRLGMESALNSFLNEMYENTEYLKDVASSVRGSLQEMEALMSGAEATEVEYQVQKWMGSLYSVGMSQEAVQSIASALGQIAAGQVDALTNGSGAGNLLVMAASDAGLTISDILTDGLNADETNRLLQATVNYLADIAEASKDNKVVQQQLAGVFGVKASDLRAATNLATDNTTANVYKEYLTYDNMLRQLYKMAGTMGARTSIGEMMTNVWENGQYTLAGSMASSPVSYLLYKTATLLDNTAGGIDFGLPLVMGNGMPISFNVADIMRVGAIGTGILGSLGELVSGLASSFSGQNMLASMGIDSGSGLKVTPRGTGDGVGASDIPGASGGATSTSGSGYVGNASGSDIKNSTIQETEDSAKKQVIEAQEEAGATQVDFINANVLKIYELLDEVANGKRSLSVKVEGYGLTKLNNSTALSSAQGGVAGLLSNNTATNSVTNDALNSGFGGAAFGAGAGVGAGSSTGIGTGGGSGVGSSGIGSSSGTGGGSAASNGVNIGTTIGLGGWTMT